MIECLIGISNSGKSTYARETAAKATKRTIIVNRDKIRELLFGFDEKSIVEYYQLSNFGQNEQLVTDYETSLIRHALNRGDNVIVDATHLKMRYINRFKSFGVSVKYTLFNCSIHIALARDCKRNRQVGVEVIRKQIKNLNELKKVFDFKSFIPPYHDIPLVNDSSKKPCYIFDIDGTLAIKSDRSPYDWSKIGEDSLNQSVASVYKILREDTTIRPVMIICTGRDGICLDQTIKWLTDNGIFYDKFYIRKTNDNRPDWIVKEEFWREIVKKHYIVAMYDDRNQIVNHARRLGLSCFQVNYGNF